MSSKLKKNFQQIYFNKEKFCWERFKIQNICWNTFTNTEQNSALVNVSSYSKRITKTFVNFFSKIKRRSTLLYTYFTKDSNLFFVKLMSRCAKIRLFNLLLQSDFKWLGLVYNLLLLDFAIYIYICICSMLCNFYPVCLLIFYQSCNHLSWWKTKKTSFLTRCCHSHPTLPSRE